MWKKMLCLTKNGANKKKKEQKNLLCGSRSIIAKIWGMSKYRTYFWLFICFSMLDTDSSCIMNRFIEHLILVHTRACL